MFWSTVRGIERKLKWKLLREKRISFFKVKNLKKGETMDEKRKVNMVLAKKYLSVKQEK